MFSVLLAPFVYTVEDDMRNFPGLPLGMVATDNGFGFAGLRGEESPYTLVTLAASGSGGYPADADWQMATTPITSNAGRH